MEDNGTIYIYQKERSMIQESYIQRKRMKMSAQYEDILKKSKAFEMDIQPVKYEEIYSNSNISLIGVTRFVRNQLIYAEDIDTV